MSFLAITILTTSAIIHALWNLLGKGQSRPSKEFFFLANTFGCIAFIPTLVISGISLHWSYSVWFCIILTGLFEAIYFTSVAESYYHGDISVAYPISRSLPVILVIIFGIIFEHSVEPSLIFVGGSILVIIGCISTSMKHFQDFKLKNYFSPSCLFAYTAAIASAGYLITDNKALHLLNNTTALNVFQLSIIYSFIRGISISGWMGLSIIGKQKYRKHTYSILKTSFWQSVLAGLSMYLSYTLVLFSMYLTKNLSYVALFRQLSIPVTVIAGIYFFKEKRYLPKATGISLILIGLTLVTI